jgi:sugar phosphate permease
MPSEPRPQPDRARSAHYGWTVLAISTLTVMGSIGLARFGYTLILPAMQDSLSMSNTQTGALATANFLGYLVLAVVGGALASRYRPRWVIGISMLVAGTAMVLTGVATGFAGAFVWRMVTGVGSGGANVPVMSLVPAWFSARRRGMATGIAVGGSSLGLVLMGTLLPGVLERGGAVGWRYGWFVLGSVVLVLGVLGLIFLRDRPGDKGLRPVGARGEDDSLGPGLARPAGRVQGAGLADWSRVYRNRALWHLAIVYIAFGLSYVIYSTFFAKYLIAEGGYSRQAAGGLWAIIGWISILSGIGWGSLSDRIGRKYALALVYLIQAFSFTAFALWRTDSGYVASVIAFGLTGWSIPGIVAAACSDYVGSRLAPAAFGFATLFFGLGQVAGPTIGGWLADATGSFAPAFLLAGSVALLGAIGSVLLQSPDPV